MSLLLPSDFELGEEAEDRTVAAVGDFPLVDAARSALRTRTGRFLLTKPVEVVSLR